jgi:phosphoribosylanthranilate isomerase
MLKIKVCGMKMPQNIADVAVLQPNYMGFIFYPPSKRYINHLSPLALESIPKTVKKVGVFVQASISSITQLAASYDLQYIQLHGNESPDYCWRLQEALPHVKLIKAFSIHNNFDFTSLSAYEATCAYLLLDTKGKAPGGNGIKFNWELLQQYTGTHPIMLSGGIKPKDITAIKNICQIVPAIKAIDVNSGFETIPGVKNVQLLRNFITKIRA